MHSFTLKPSPGLDAVVSILREAGHRAYAVGGAVRDGLMGHELGDWDVATDARPERVQALFDHTYPMGIEHGTVGVREAGETVEITTFRADVETDGRHAVVRFGTSLEEDLARRDFTINALAWDPAVDQIIDPFGGRDDLAAGRLRTVGDADRRLTEDVLRILRAFRFAARFDLRIDDDLALALTRHAAGVTRLSGERVRDELLKTFRQCDEASRALDGWFRSGVLARLLPELAVCFGVEQNRFHAHDVGVHTLHVVDAVSRRRPLIRMAALLHDVGKPPARTVHETTGDWTFPDHAAVGARLARQVLERLRFSNREKDRVAHLVAIHMDIFPEDATDAAIRRWIRRVGRQHIWDLYRLHLADWRGNPKRGAERPLVEMYLRVRSVEQAEDALTLADLAVTGADLIELGLPPGPRFGGILANLLERVIEEPSLNRRDRLLEIVRGTMADGSPAASG